MDQRRFITFLILSLGIFTLSQMLFPPPPPVEQEAVVGVEGAEQPPAVEEPQAGAAELKQAAPEDEQAPEAVDMPAEPVQADIAAEPSPVAFATLGSIDPSSGYRMLVTFTSLGGAVERVELSNPRFRDLHDRHGYLGHLIGASRIAGGNGPLVGDGQAANGLTIDMVGAGTPAAVAGLQPGDRITDWRMASGEGDTDDTPRTWESLGAFLRTTQPGDEIVLDVTGDDGGSRQVSATLGRAPLEVIRPEIENVKMREEELVEPNFVSPPSFATELSEVVGVPIADLAADEHWQIADQGDGYVSFVLAVPKVGIEIEKRYRLVRVPEAELENLEFPGYHLDLEVTMRNIGDVARTVGYTLDGPNGLPVEGWWYAFRMGRTFGASGLRDVAIRFKDGPIRAIAAASIDSELPEPMGQGRPLLFVGVDAQYFAAMMIPQKSNPSDVWIEATEVTKPGPELSDRAEVKLHNISFAAKRIPIPVAPGATHQDSYQLFLGPKVTELLLAYHAPDSPVDSLGDLLYYGWFGAVARGMLGVLHFFYAIVGNYGIAIILLTIVVKLCLFPLSVKQTRSMARMQAIRPELDRITEQYKSDPQKKAQAMQDLYRKENINPLAGCMPALIQLPILMGLYRALMVDTELRQSPLLGEGTRWCSNLAGPDMFYDWSSYLPDMITRGQGLFGLGPYLNILPLVTVVFFLISQKMTMPEPTNEQAALQQSMFKYMTMFMAILFYKVAAGLCIYFITSSVWGIGERKLLPVITGHDPSRPSGGTSVTEPGKSPAVERSEKKNAKRSNGKQGKGKSKKRKK